MNTSLFRSGLAVSVVLGLAACGGGGGGGGGDEGLPTESTDPPVETTDPSSYQELSDTTPGSAGLTYVLLEGEAARFSDAPTLNYANGQISSSLLDGRDIDDATFTNPANGEFSRVFQISRAGQPNLFGVVGLDVNGGDVPTGGSTDYNEGWVGMTAIFEDDVLVLEGDASFTVTWDGAGNIDGRFFNLSGTNSDGQNVTNQGIIVLTGGTMNGDQFSGGRMTGEGVFSGLGPTTSSAGTQGAFFGPDADELGGVLIINDVSEDIRVVGAFQAD